MKLNVKGIPKADLLRVLYNAAKPLGMGFLHYTPEDMSPEEAESIIAKQTYFDYMKGRVMKVYLDRDVLEARLYDRDNGEGAAKKAIESLGVAVEVLPEQ